MRWALVLVVAASCKRESVPESPVRGYGDLVKQTQTGSATETRTVLACAASIVVPPRPDHTPSTVPATERAAREAKLAAMTGTTLAREATQAELLDVVLARLMKSLDEPMTMSAAERDVWLWNDYAGEVYNGGHHQFFFNSSGNDSLEVRDALGRIGASDVRAIYDCALTAFPDGKPAHDRGERNEQLARWGDKQFDIFERLDSAFYAASTWEPVLDKYIRAHIADMPNVQKP